MGVKLKIIAPSGSYDSAIEYYGIKSIEVELLNRTSRTIESRRSKNSAIQYGIVPKERTFWRSISCSGNNVLYSGRIRKCQKRQIAFDE